MAVVSLLHDSAALASNPLGDPARRACPVVVPDDDDPREPLPCIWWLAGYAGVGAKSLAHDPWEEGLDERVARLRREGRLGRVRVALPDAFTRYGGSQYLSSSAHGDYETYLVHELRAHLEARFATSAHAIAGKSSGGFGALALATRHPGVYRAVACHSGDMGFGLAYRPDIPHLMNAVHQHGSLEAFVAAFARAPKKKDHRWFAPMSVLALAASYSPDPSAPLGVALPFSLEAGAIDEAVFARWLALDPVELALRAEVQATLRALALLFVDCGARDEHQLHWGARAFSRRLRAAQVPHVYEEFDDGHRATSYRLDVSLPRLAEALGAPR